MDSIGRRVGQSPSPSLRAVSCRPVLLLLLCVLWVLCGCRSTLPECTDALGCIVLRPNEPVQIGYLLALSGEAAVLGEEQLRGIELAIADRGGTILGHDLLLVGIDSECHRAAVATSLPELLAGENVVAIIGPTCSDAVHEALPIVAAAGLSLISPSATAADLPATLPPETAVDHFFRTAHDSRAQADVAARFAFTSLRARTAVTVDDNSRYAQSLQQQFTSTFERLGGRVLHQRVIDVGQTLVDDALADAFSDGPDVVFAPLFAPEANLLVNELRESDNNSGVAFIGTDTLLLPDFPIGSGSAAEGIYLTGTAVSGPRYQEFVSRWTARFGAPPTGPFHAHAYDATNLLLDALMQVAETSSNGTLQLGRQALQRAIAATENFDGVTGSLSCQKGECASGTAVGIYQISDQQVDGASWPPPIIWTPQQPSEE